MSQECTHNCDTCQLNCESRENSGIQKELPNAQSRIKKAIAVVSGKGGVGKSLTTGLLATMAQRMGYKTAIMDADITGPSIPKMFKFSAAAGADETALIPAVTATGIRVMSVNLLLENETDPVIWRGPVIAGTVKQFWTDVNWGDIDIMFIDMPPGTGDVPLTVFQSIPVDGMIVVTSPQELVGMVVQKAVNMASMMNIPVMGIVENMSYIECPDCGKKIELYGESRLGEAAKLAGTDVTARIPVQPKLAAACDKGMIELFEGDWMDEMLKKIL
ncbi:MAG: Mrp/NBP35 family ATP-binding protein [Clostridia bacterium]|nr:Mrp/NBP35 family ATP-binding protein [Clostridia bacterium]